MRRRLSTVLVTGAAGFIGSHTVDMLLSMGHKVVGVDNLRTGSLSNLDRARASSRFKWANLDILEESLLTRLMQETGPSAVIHLAALVSVPESIQTPEENFRLNVAATESVAACARRQGVSRFVYASSAAVYGIDSKAPLPEETYCEPQSPYGAAKLASEALLLGYARAYGITVRCQRYFNVFGPRQSSRSPYSGVISLFVARCQNGDVLTINGDGEQTRDFISVRDVARANALAATTPAVASGIANICTGHSTSINLLISHLECVMGRPLNRHHISARPGDIRHSRGDPDRARRELGFIPSISFESALREYILATKREPKTDP